MSRLEAILNWLADCIGINPSRFLTQKAGLDTYLRWLAECWRTRPRKTSCELCGQTTWAKQKVCSNCWGKWATKEFIERYRCRNR